MSMKFCKTRLAMSSFLLLQNFILNTICWAPMERRRQLRNLSLWQRTEGLTAARMVEGRKSILYACFFFAISMFAPAPVQRCLTVMGLYFSSRYYQCAFGPRLLVPPLVRLNRRINDYDPVDFKNKFRFEQRHAFAVFDCLSVWLYCICVLECYTTYFR